MKRTALLMFALAALFGASRWLSADESKDKDKPCCPVAGGGCCGGETCSDSATTAAEAKCPVSGEKISKEVAVDYRGGKVYLCCAGCVPKFKENAAKYGLKANEQLVLTGQAKQKGCPLSGNKVNESTKIEIDGIAVAFCCAGCQGKVKQASAEKQREMVFGDKAFEKAFAVSKPKKEKAEN